MDVKCKECDSLLTAARETLPSHLQDAILNDAIEELKDQTDKIQTQLLTSLQLTGKTYEDWRELNQRCQHIAQWVKYKTRWTEKAEEFLELSLEDELQVRNSSYLRYFYSFVFNSNLNDFTRKNSVLIFFKIP